MRYFLSVSFAILLFSCSPKVYQDKQDIILSQSYTAGDLRPHFSKELYRCVVDGKFALKKFHLSGILYFRTLEDKTTRVIFQSEMGNTFFDFGWDASDSFKVFSIIDQMDRAALIKTLKKDFELLLVKNIHDKPSGTYRFNNSSENYIRFELPKGFVYYITDSDRKLTGIENADDKHKVVAMQMPATPLQQLPEKITIKHLRAGFTIDLKKINTDDTTE